MLATAARHWWVLVLQGILGIAFGILALLLPDLTLITLAYLFAAWALISGFSEIAEGWRVAEARGRSWPFAVGGIVSIVAGLLAAFLPGLTVAGLILFLGSWLIIAGVMEAYAAYRVRREISNEWLLALAGVARAALGFLILVMPIVGVIVTVAFVGYSAIVAGLVALGLGLRLRSLRPGVGSMTGRSASAT
jgi:uncharacterized membrane protein HdeD (DUF308 family)